MKRFFVYMGIGMLVYIVVSALTSCHRDEAKPNHPQHERIKTAD